MKKLISALLVVLCMGVVSAESMSKTLDNGIIVWTSGSDLVLVCNSNQDIMIACSDEDPIMVLQLYVQLVTGDERQAAMILTMVPYMAKQLGLTPFYSDELGALMYGIPIDVVNNILKGDN